MLLERQDTLRDNIRYARMKLGWQVKDLALAAGVGKTTISNFEAGGKKLGDMALFKIAKALRVEPDSLKDPSFRLRFQPTGTVKPEPTPVPEPKFEDFVQLLKQMTPAQRDAIIEVMRVMADGNLKKI